MPTITNREWLLMGLYTLSRVVYYFFYPFRIDYLPWLNQLLDVEILKHNLLEGLWYLHVTPPLYNLYVGLLLQIGGAYAGLLFAALTTLIGIGVCLMTYRLVQYCGGSQLAASIATLLVILNPILLRFESIPFYTYPLAFLLLLSVYALIRFTRAPTRTSLILFLTIPVVILLFRNFFHIIFFFIPITFGTCLLCYYHYKHLLKTALIASVVLFAVGALPSFHNYLQYGSFISSTWQGMQFFSLTHFVPRTSVEALVQSGEVTPLALLPRFQNPDIYYEYYHQTPLRGIPAIDDLYKTGTSYGNFNNWIYVQTSEEYGADTVAILKEYPQYVPIKLANSLYIFFGVANYRFFDNTKEWLIFNGSPLHKVFQATKYFVQPVLLAVVFLAALWWLARRYRNPVMLYILFILLYTVGVANVVELGENYTARVPIDPLITVIGVVIVCSAINQYRLYRKAQGSSDTAGQPLP